MADFDPASDPEVIALFASEAGDRVARLTVGLDQLAAADAAVLATCRREAHTLKGTAAMMGLAPVAESAGRLEGLLGAETASPDIDAVRAELAVLTRLVAEATSPAAD